MYDNLSKSSLLHIPHKPDVFEFDESVAKAFPDMARRSIPMYAAAHALHASMFIPAKVPDSGLVIYDVGSSRGGFFEAVCNRLQKPIVSGDDRLEAYAIDSSLPMLNLLNESMPWVNLVHGTLPDLGDFAIPADIICMNYVLQFMRSKTDRIKTLQWAARNLREDGVLILGQKTVVSDTFSTAFASRYNEFRLSNGYTQEQIDAKTAALKNSMWPISSTEQESMCYNAGFIDYTETTRWLQFSTAICVKG